MFACKFLWSGDVRSLRQTELIALVRTHLICQLLLRRVTQFCKCEDHRETRQSLDAFCALYNSSSMFHKLTDCDLFVPEPFLSMRSVKCLFHLHELFSCVQSLLVTGVIFGPAPDWFLSTKLINKPKRAGSKSFLRGHTLSYHHRFGLIIFVVANKIGHDTTS